MVRGLAQVISIIFHPLLVVSYCLVIYLLVNPFAFGVHSIGLQAPFLATVFILTFVFPVAIVIMARKLGLVESITLNKPMDRIIPYIGTGIFYLWLYATTRQNYEIPMLMKSFILGATISLFLLFFVNNFSKISAHMSGMGGMLFFSILLANGLGGMVDFGSFNFPGSAGSQAVFPATVLIISGLVASSRLVLQAHTQREIVGGLIVGILGQIIAFRIYF